MNSRMINPLEHLEIALEMKFRGELAKQLVKYAERLKMEPVEMLADLIEAAIKDDLIEDILDKTPLQSATPMPVSPTVPSPAVGPMAAAGRPAPAKATALSKDTLPSPAACTTADCSRPRQPGKDFCAECLKRKMFRP